MPEIQTKRRAVQERRLTVDDVIRFYADRRSRKPANPHTFEPEEWTLTNTPTGIGDAVMLTDLERSAHYHGLLATSWLCCEAFDCLRRLNPYHRDTQQVQWVSISLMQAKYDLGPGHTIQRIQRMFDLPVRAVPRGCIVVPERAVRGRVSLHLVPGAHAKYQKRFHPRPREVYPENLDVLRQFINAHQELSFFEVGGTILSDIIPNMHGASLESTIHEMAKCVLHIGIVSGPYHIAQALGMRTIVILNFPKPWELMLPVLQNVDVVEAEWLYPSSHILHQDVDSLHWPKFNLRNLERAYHKETFPYDEAEKFSNLIVA
jgi:hypothetical protein